MEFEAECKFLKLLSNDRDQNGRVWRNAAFALEAIESLISERDQLRDELAELRDSYTDLVVHVHGGDNERKREEGRAINQHALQTLRSWFEDV